MPSSKKDSRRKGSDSEEKERSKRARRHVEEEAEDELSELEIDDHEEESNTEIIGKSETTSSDTPRAFANRAANRGTVRKPYVPHEEVNGNTPINQLTPAQIISYLDQLDSQDVLSSINKVVTPIQQLENLIQLGEVQTNPALKFGCIDVKKSLTMRPSKKPRFNNDNNKSNTRNTNTRFGNSSSYSETNRGNQF